MEARALPIGNLHDLSEEIIQYLNRLIDTCNQFIKDNYFLIVKHEYLLDALHTSLDDIYNISSQTYSYNQLKKTCKELIFKSKDITYPFVSTHQNPLHSLIIFPEKISTFKEKINAISDKKLKELKKRWLNTLNDFHKNPIHRVNYFLKMTAIKSQSENNMILPEKKPTILSFPEEKFSFDNFTHTIKKISTFFSNHAPFHKKIVCELIAPDNVNASDEINQGVIADKKKKSNFTFSEEKINSQRDALIPIPILKIIIDLAANADFNMLMILTFTCKLFYNHLSNDSFWEHDLSKLENNCIIANRLTLPEKNHKQRCLSIFNALQKIPSQFCYLTLRPHGLNGTNYLDSQFLIELLNKKFLIEHFLSLKISKAYSEIYNHYHQASRFRTDLQFNFLASVNLKKMEELINNNNYDEIFNHIISIEAYEYITYQKHIVIDVVYDEKNGFFQRLENKPSVKHP